MRFILALCLGVMLFGCQTFGTAPTSTTKDLGSGGSDVSVPLGSATTATATALAKAEAGVSWIWSCVTRLRANGVNAVSLGALITGATDIADYVKQGKLAEADRAFNTAWNLAATLAKGL
jgi:hypothetical protein